MSQHGSNANFSKEAIEKTQIRRANFNTPISWLGFHSPNRPMSCQEVVLHNLRVISMRTSWVKVNKRSET
jgi:hypothetical protein